MRHDHQNATQLVAGCSACIERVRGDQFWAEFLEECDDPAFEDVEFGLAAPISVVFANHIDDDRVRQFAEFIPTGVLTAIFLECGDGTVRDDLMRVAAYRLTGCEP